MSTVVAIAYRKRPPKGYGDTLRALVPGAHILSSQPANSTAVRGPDTRIFHLPTTSLPPGPARNRFYSNEIWLPMMREAITHGDIVLTLHDDVIVTKEQVANLINLVERIPQLVFASAAPRTIPMPDGTRIPSDWTDRCVAWRSTAVSPLLQIFTEAEMGEKAESNMQAIMARILAAGGTEASWIWMNEIVPEEPAPPELPVSPIPPFPPIEL